MNHLRMMGKGFVKLVLFLIAFASLMGLSIGFVTLMNHVVGSMDWVPWFLLLLLVAGVSYMIGWEEKIETEQEKLG